ncbi:MAG TPA: hypothetical protein VJT13_08395 [Xanthobacteraceae bacterium]|nr:hypothetical protein [Xanthobacteraceae bacterium]
MPVNLPDLRSAEARSAKPGGIGAHLGYAAVILAGVAVWGFSRATLQPDLVMPLVSTLLLALAALFGVAAWWRGWMDPNGVTFRDVAGALTLIGLCAAATIEPDQMLRIIQGSDAE